MVVPKAFEDVKLSEIPEKEWSQAPIMDFGDIKLDMVTHQIIAGGRCLKLSPKEFPLVYILISHHGEFVDRAELCAAMGSASEDTSLENQLYRLRKKLKEIGYCIVALRGRGHRLEKTKD